MVPVSTLTPCKQLYIWMYEYTNAQELAVKLVFLICQQIVNGVIDCPPFGGATPAGSVVSE